MMVLVEFQNVHEFRRIKIIDGIIMRKLKRRIKKAE